MSQKRRPKGRQNEHDLRNVDVVKRIGEKALQIARTPKKDRAEKFGDLFKKLPRPIHEEVPLHQQLWFRAMVDRIERGEMIYKGRVKTLGLDPDEKVMCDHQHCRHRECFHAYEISTGSGHMKKSRAGFYIYSKERGLYSFVS